MLGLLLQLATAPKANEKLIKLYSILKQAIQVGIDPFK